MLELKHITKTFDTDAGRVKAVDDVSLTINPGEIFGIIGFSGAGKSTLVRCINLLETPSSSTARTSQRFPTPISASFAAASA